MSESNRLFIGNLQYDVDDDMLGQELTDAGVAAKTWKVILDRDTRRSRGFAFVEFETVQAAKEAMAILNGLRVAGRALNVNFANEREQRGGGGGQQRSREAADRHRREEWGEGSRGGGRRWRD